ncbi:MAG: pilus assembly protein [Thermochromatium sp.]
MPRSILIQGCAGLASAALMGLSVLAGAVTLPSIPLNTMTASPPMTLLVAAKDHRLFYEAYNDASDVDGDGTLDIRFNPNITYYGLFDADLCYSYSGSGNSGLFSPVSQATNGKCPGKWSGNWLNYVTTSRIDALRKVLYGGYREVDDTTQTILRRSYIPQDAHSWAKEYTSQAVDGYKISDYTPLPQPEPDKRHFFGNLTSNAYTNCATLNTCSDLPPLLSVVTNSTKRVWDWASKERPVLDWSHGGTRTDYTVRVKVCTNEFHQDCKRYPNGTWKPVGILHEYGEDNAMLFGLLTGSYNPNMAGGRLRKVVSSFASEIDPQTGIFKNPPNSPIVTTFNRLRIRDYNNGRTDQAYRGGWVTTRSMDPGEFVDWGNPLGEMLYEGLRYFAGKKSATPAFVLTTSFPPNDAELDLSEATWDDPYDPNSAAKADWCAKPNLIAISDVNVSFDSDQVPGSAFGSFSGDLTGLNVATECDTISVHEPGIVGDRFIGQSGATYDSAPTAKPVTSLARVRGLAPEEPTKQGSYYSAAVAYFGKRSDLRPLLTGKQSVDFYAIALSSPLPRLEARLPNGQLITLVPFAKSVGGFGISNTKGQFQPTNQIVDLYIEEIANSGAGDANPNVNGGRYYAKFRINYEDVEQGADHDMDVIAEYTLTAKADNTLEVRVKTTYEAGSIKQNVGYIISGTTKDGVYLVAQDEPNAISYFLNVPPNRDPGYCDANTPPSDCGLLPCATGQCSNKTESVRIFSPGSSTAGLLKDPLWYAAKWGGFIDQNNNDRPDLNAEWDADGDGMPDTYFLVQNPLKLKETLRRTLETIIERSASSGSITANSTRISSDTQVFQATYNTSNWSGDLKAYPVSSSGVGSTPNWQASQQLPAPADRRIFIRQFDGTAKEFLWEKLSEAEKTALNDEYTLDYLRGVRTREQRNNGPFRNRSIDNVLGDIVHSAPFYVKETDTLYIGANDGMLHAFNASSGQELFAYIPRALIGALKDLSAPGYSHRYFVDGQIDVSQASRTNGINYLVATLGQGGKGLFTLNVTNPTNFNVSAVGWDYFDPRDPNLGYLLGSPKIAKMNNDQWAVIVGNGYNSNEGTAALYVFKLDDGTLMKKINTKVGGDNGLGTPGLFDSDDDGDIDFIYAGDLKGNLWKFDVRGGNPATWRVAFSNGATPAPLFTARDPNGNPQPITAQPTIGLNPISSDANFGRRYVWFGTGSYFKSGDPADTQIQTWYGLIDDGEQITGRDKLVQRSIKQEGEFAGRRVRTFHGITPGDMEGKKGWYIDFNFDPVNRGERIVTASKLIRISRRWVLEASSIIPVNDPCEPGGRGYLNQINPFTGGHIDAGLLDINKNGDFSDDKLGGDFIGGIGFDAMPGEPIQIGDLTVVGLSDGTQQAISSSTSVVVTGRQSWREIVTE